MALLDLIQDVSKTMGMPSPTVVMTSADTRVLELLIMADTTGKALTRRYEWQELVKTSTFTTTGTIDQGFLTGSIATDFGYFINQTFWNRTLTEPILGPVTPQRWQADLSGLMTSPPYEFVVQADKLFIGPTALDSGDTCVFNYSSKNWCESAAGVGQDNFAADTDVTLIPQELFKLDLIWRWRQSKGLAYAEDLETAEDQIESYIGQNTGRRVLFIGGGAIYYTDGNIPGGNWPQVAP
jgi:hypothetical protein